MHDFTVIIFMLKIDFLFYIIGNIYLKIRKNYDMHNDNLFLNRSQMFTQSILMVYKATMKIKSLIHCNIKENNTNIIHRMYGYMCYIF